MWSVGFQKGVVRAANVERMVFSANGAGPIRSPCKGMKLNPYLILYYINSEWIRDHKTLRKNLWDKSDNKLGKHCILYFIPSHLCISVKQSAFLRTKVYSTLIFFCYYLSIKKKVAVKVLSPNPWTTRERPYLTFKIRCFPEWP